MAAVEDMSYQIEWQLWARNRSGGPKAERPLGAISAPERTFSSAWSSGSARSQAAMRLSISFDGSAPLGDGLLIDPVAFCPRPQTSAMYRSTDHGYRRGPPAQNLAPSASFHSEENNAPSKSVVKHVVVKTIDVSS